jgi:hypothetical protein
VPAGQAMQIIRSVPHGHVAAVWAQAKALGLPALLGPSGRYRDLALALIIARVLHPASKLATGSWWDDTALGVDLEVAGASTDETYAAMDWLLTRQGAIRATLAKPHLADPDTASIHVTISVGNKPAATITSPQDGVFFEAGDVISFADPGTDTEDGSLPASAFSWNIDFLHEGHVHPGIPSPGSKAAPSPSRPAAMTSVETPATGSRYLSPIPTD